ncbi:HYR domain-containing protein [Marivirga sp.]|uniref:HYR domain-containing protein n=1 Tax=Marivirga sp. TaxID=2018662 RepID=UPI003DA767EA
MYKKIIILIFYFVSFSFLSTKGEEGTLFSKSEYLEINNSIRKEEEKGFFFLVCPADIEETVTDACETAVNWTEPTSSDPNVTDITSTHTPGDIFPLGETTVTYTGKNIDGDIIEQCSFVVTVKLDVTSNYVFADDKCDTGDITRILTESCNRAVTWIEPGVPCDEIQLIRSHDPGDEFLIGTTTVEYIAFYDGKILDQCSFDITLVDNFDPVFDTCPSNITLDANENCQAVATWTEPEASDNCGFVPELTSDFANGSTFPIGTTTVTYTATDEGGNTAQCSFDVTVVDNTGPEFLNIPAEVKASADESCGAIASWDEIQVEDNCSANNDIIINSDAASGDRFNLGQTLVTYTATDLAGNETLASFLVIVEDNTIPSTENCPTNITVFANANCESSATWDIPTFTDNCDSNPQVTSSHNPGDTFPFGETEVTYTATDDAGNEAICSFTVSVQDNTPPVFSSIPDDLIVSTQEDACEVVVNWGEILAEDNCDNSLDIVTNFNSGDVFPLGETTVEITATDDAGNETSASFLITVEDQIPPQALANPTDITISSSSDCDTLVNWEIPTFSDNCDADLEITSTHNSGDLFQLGTTTVTYTATDNAGNETLSSFDVIVVDETAPDFISCVPNIELTANNQCQATATWSLPAISDNCNGEISLESDFQSGDIFPLGSTTVTYTATDETGNSSNCSFEVIVSDQTPPNIITQLNDLVVAADEDACQTAVSWNTITAEDNCSEEVQITSSFNSGDIFQIGESTVEVTARDNSGNETTTSFKVTVEDNTAPTVVSCPNDITVSAKGNCESLANWEIPEFTDNCDIDLSITSSHNPREIFPLGTTLVTYTATDDAGNEKSCSFNVIVEDDKMPDFTTCVSDIKLTANDQCSAIAEWTTPEVVDNCDANITLESDFQSGDSFSFGTTTVTYSATDDAGNTNTCSFNVIVEDKSAPVLISCPDKQIINANENCIGIADWEEPVFEDCSNLTISSNYQIGEELPLGITNIEYTATDENGEITLCTFEVEVIDQSAPIISFCPEDISVIAPEDCEAIVEWEIPTATDNCTEVSISSNFEPGTVFPIGITNVEYEFTDENGNRSFCSFEVNVLDDFEIIIDNCPEDIILNAENSSGTASINWEEPTATSACSQLNVSSSHNPGDTFEVGSTMVSYTFSKENGQSEICTFEVTIEPLVLDVQISKLVSPNGDGNNDSWLIEGIEQFPDNQVIIVDRWGAEIFRANGYNNSEVIWRGENKNGEIVPRGTYYYFISVRNEQDAIERKGFLEILR